MYQVTATDGTVLQSDARLILARRWAEHEGRDDWAELRPTQRVERIRDAYHELLRAEGELV